VPGLLIGPTGDEVAQERWWTRCGASGDPGSRGPFSDRAHDRSPLLWLDLHRKAVAAAAAALAASAVGLAITAKTR
ncbi:MAG: hypothetical protein ABR498_04210, partial [Candidatus Dormibacteria bacterium]